MNFRKIKRSDEEQIHKLATEQHNIMKSYASFPVYKVKFTEELFRKIFSTHFKKNHFIHGIEDNDKIIAMISGYIKPAPNGDVGYIDNMMITKKYQGKGIAKLLRDGFYAWLKEQNIKYCQLNVLAKNTKAIKVYEKWGFKVDGLQMTTKV